MYRFYEFEGGNRNGPPFQYLIGASQVALEYDRENSGLFEFTYLHSPHYDKEFNETVAIFYDTNVEKVRQLTRAAGIIFVDIIPNTAKTFLQNLGFDISKMIMQLEYIDENNIQILNWNNNNLTTENLFTLASALPSTNNYLPSGIDEADPSVFPFPDWDESKGYTFLKTSTITRSLSATNTYRFTNLCPFIIIELVTTITNNYISKDENNKFINAIVSRNYTTNNYITGYSDSGILYHHNGESVLLSNILCRLINPFTKQPLDDIGPKNYVLLDIIKNVNV